MKVCLLLTLEEEKNDKGLYTCQHISQYSNRAFTNNSIKHKYKEKN